jgi:hypothetical protein
MAVQLTTPIAFISLAKWRDIAQIASYLFTAAAAWLAWGTYRTNSKRERAKWAVQLYEKFYEGTRYRELREALDCDADNTSVKQLVRDESAEFTDYLNFFELVCFLAQTDQISELDVLTLFDYCLRCLKKHTTVVQYINRPDHGFEQLRVFLPKVKGVNFSLRDG